MSLTKTEKKTRRPRERAFLETREEALERLLNVALAVHDGDYDLDYEADARRGPKNLALRPSRKDLVAAGLATDDMAAEDLPTSWEEAFRGECLYWLECSKRGEVANAPTLPSKRIGADLVRS